MSSVSSTDLISVISDLYCIGDIDINLKNNKGEIIKSFGKVLKKIGIEDIDLSIENEDFCKNLLMIKSKETISKKDLQKISSEHIEKVKEAGLNNEQIVELITMAQEMKDSGTLSQDILKKIYIYLKNSNIISLINLYNTYQSICIILSLFGLVSYTEAGFFSMKTLVGLGLGLYSSRVKNNKEKDRKEGVRFVPKGTTGKILSYLTIKNEDFYDKIFIDEEVPEEVLQYLDDKGVKYLPISFGDKISKEDAYNSYFFIKHLERKKMINFKGDWIENKVKLNYFDIPRIILGRNIPKNKRKELNPHRMITFLVESRKFEENEEELDTEELDIKSIFDKKKKEKQIKDEFNVSKNYEDILSYAYVPLNYFNEKNIRKSYEYMTGKIELINSNFSYNEKFLINPDKKSMKNENLDFFATLYMVKRFKKIE